MLSTQGTIYSTSLAASALELLVEGLRGVIRDPMDVLARETLATGAVISAQGLRVAGVGAPHAFAAALAGVLADVRHGPLVFASMLAVLGDELRTQRSLHNLSAVSCRLSFSDDRAMLQHFAALYSEHVAGTVHVGSMRRHGLHEVAREVTSHPRLITHPSEMNCDRVKRIAAKIRGVLKLGDIDGAIAE
jgi:alcohol dehydrogenase class IV